MARGIDPVTNAVANVDVSLPFSGINTLNGYRPRVDLIQKVNNHDVAVIDVPNMLLGGSTPTLGYGAPVSIDWGLGANRGSLVGYVHSTEMIVTEQYNGARIVTVSAGFPMKRRSQRVWSETSASAVALRLAEEHGLRADVEDHPRVFPQIAQQGQSDWELLRGLAQTIGFHLRVEGVTLQFMSPARLARYYRPLAPAVKVTERDSFTSSVLHEIRQFHPALTEHATDGEAVLAQHVVTTLDAGSGTLVRGHAQGPVDASRGHQQPIHQRFSTATARTRVDAEQIALDTSQRNRYPLRATGQMSGVPALQPNRCLYVDGPNGGGYWTILEARHSLGSGAVYTVDLVLGSEGPGDDRFTSRDATDTVTSIPNNGLLRMPYPDARLTQGEYGVALPAGVPQFERGPRWVAA